ncbi:MAG: hypothetical protein AB7L41_15275 [Flavobacteriaceae bacterium]
MTTPTRIRTAGLLALALAAAACSSGSDQMAPQATVRNTANTAPADLQLLCASQAATTFNVQADKVLPVSSAMLDGNVYRVELSMEGRRADCLIDNNGTITSLQEVAS